jgi:uncharacterized protein YcbK (DUF882 family)
MDWSKIKHFNPEEFTCRCGCGLNNINLQLVGALDMARKDAGVPFTISSGCRCSTHNRHIGGVSDSAHVGGYAVDIQVRNSAERLRVLKSLVRYFDRIGMDRNFIHVDIDPSKPGPALWLYK